MDFINSENFCFAYQAISVISGCEDVSFACICHHEKEGNRLFLFIQFDTDIFEDGTKGTLINVDIINAMN
jgi:hypothetical protein